jgi:hypothetical protein
MNEIIDAGQPAPMVMVPQRATPADLVASALARGASIEQLQQLMEMQIRWEAHEAEKAFNEAMAAFKANPPEILKDKHVHYVGNKGAVDYDHATHFGVTKAIAAGLAHHGLSHSWKSTQEGGKITVTCTVKHRAGHSDSTSLSAEYDSSGGKNAIQAIGSAKTYLERYTLLGITGLSTSDIGDDDGHGAGNPPSPQTVEDILQLQLSQLAKAVDLKVCIALANSGRETIRKLGDSQAYAEYYAAAVHRISELKGAA